MCSGSRFWNNADAISEVAKQKGMQVFNKLSSFVIFDELKSELCLFNKLRPVTMRL